MRAFGVCRFYKVQGSGLLWDPEGRGFEGGRVLGSLRGILMGPGGESIPSKGADNDAPGCKEVRFIVFVFSCTVWITAVGLEILKS